MNHLICNNCGVKFSTKSNLNYHQKTAKYCITTINRPDVPPSIALLTSPKGAGIASRPLWGLERSESLNRPVGAGIASPGGRAPSIERKKDNITEVKNSPCPNCDKIFISNESLLRHQKKCLKKPVSLKLKQTQTQLLSQEVYIKELEERLRSMFKDIQIPFMKHCPPSRKNFLSYSYVLHKFIQLLEKDEFLKYFPLLKSREKLHEQDLIWKKICVELNWQFIKSI